MENTYTPLKEYLGTQGKDFSMSNLGSLAKEKGIQGYTGTDVQNKQLSGLLTPKVSTTTVSNENKIGQATNLLNQSQTYAQGRGQVTDGEITRNADGSVVQDNYQEPQLPPNSSPIYGTVNGQANRVIGYNQSDLSTGAQKPTYFDSNSSTPSQSPEEQQYNKTIDDLMARTDANTARQIASIKQRTEVLRQQQQQVNKAQEAGIKNALLMGGVTGQGSSAQYAPISSEGIVASQLNYGIQKIAELDAQEQDLINDAVAAGESKNFQLVEKKLALVEQKRQEKAKEVAEQNKLLAEENEKARERQRQTSQDMALSDLYSQGITEPQEIMSALNKGGVKMTLKEVNEGLKGLVPAGLDDLVKTLRNNGAPQDVIQKVLSSGDISEAYKNAGNFAAGGTGIVGEYNYYKAQAEAKGQIPVDFNTYQNMDANRKAKVAAAGVPGAVGTTKSGKYANDLDAFLDNVINTIPTKFGQESYKQTLSKARNDADKLRAAAAVVLKNSPAPVKEAFANQAVGMKEIEKAIKLIDEGTKTGVLKAGQQYVYNLAGKDFDPKLAAISAHLVGAIQPYRNTVTGAAWGTQEDNEYQQLFGSTKYEPQALKERLLRVKDIMQEKSVQGLSSQVDPFGTGENFFETKGGMSTNLIQGEDQAKKTIDTSYTKFAPEVKTAVKGLFNKGYTNAQVVEYLQGKGIIQ